MGEANGKMRLIDTSISDRTIQEARKTFAKHLSERLLVAMIHGNPPEDLAHVHLIAWRLAEMHYDEMIRREAEAAPVSLSERMAADAIGANARGMM